MATTYIRLALDKRRRLKDNSYPIVFKIIHNRVQSTISSGYAVNENNWNDANKIIRRSTNILNKGIVSCDLKLKLTKYTGIINDLHYHNQLDSLNISELIDRL